MLNLSGNKSSRIVLLFIVFKGGDVNETHKFHSPDYYIDFGIIVFMQRFSDLLHYERIYGADDIYWQSHIGRYRCCAAYGGYCHLFKTGLYHHT